MEFITALADSGKPVRRSRRRVTRYALRFRRIDDGVVFSLDGRLAQTLTALITAGAHGITALEVQSWAFRLADYVFKLKRRYGLVIAMELEPHNGGFHGRYRLVTPVEIVPEDDLTAGGVL